MAAPTPSAVEAAALTRALRAFARMHHRLGDALRVIDPPWGTDVGAWAGGVVALHGPGLYVNAAFAVGIDRSLQSDELDEVERRSRKVGVAPAVELTPVSHPGTRTLLAARGYRFDREVTLLHRSMHDRPGRDEPPTWLTIDAIDPDGIDPDGVARWQAVAAEGWGHTTPAARRSSDAYAAAAAIVDRPGLLIATDRASGRLRVAGGGRRRRDPGRHVDGPRRAAAGRAGRVDRASPRARCGARL